jgi:hypothetical protein
MLDKEWAKDLKDTCEYLMLAIQSKGGHEYF